MKIEVIMACLITALFASIPVAAAQAPVGDIDPANKKVLHRADDPPVVHRLRTQHRGPGDPHQPSFFKDGMDYETAWRRSEWIGICSYLGYEKSDQIDYFNPPTAIFHTIKRLKGEEALVIVFSVPKICQNIADKMPELLYKDMDASYTGQVTLGTRFLNV